MDHLLPLPHHHDLLGTMVIGRCLVNGRVPQYRLRQEVSSFPRNPPKRHFGPACETPELTSPTLVRCNGTHPCHCFLRKIVLIRQILQNLPPKVLPEKIAFPDFKPCLPELIYPRRCLQPANSNHGSPNPNQPLVCSDSSFVCRLNIDPDTMLRHVPTMPESAAFLAPGRTHRTENLHHHAMTSPRLDIFRKMEDAIRSRIAEVAVLKKLKRSCTR